MNAKVMVRPSLKAKGALDQWKKTRVFPRSIDGYAFAAAYAIRQGIDIEGVKISNRSDLTDLGDLAVATRRALEAGIHTARKRAGLALPASAEEVFELASRYAEVGIEALVERWGGKSKGQILEDIRGMVSMKRESSSGPALAR